MLLADQQHRQGRVVVEQVQEAQPLEAQHFHGGAGKRLIAIGAHKPNDVLVAQKLAGAVAKLLAAFAHHLNDPAPHRVDGIRGGTPGKNLGAGRQGEHLTVNLGRHQLNGGGDCKGCDQ